MSKSSHIEFTDNVILRAENVDVYYGSHKAVAGVNLEIPQNSVVSLIGPSGCGKSTILRCFNRMNDLVPSARMKGKILFKGKDIYDQNINPITIRSSIGMVFQQPNPFPKSIYENIAWGARINGYKGKMNDLVEESLQKAALWDEVKDNLRQSGLALSGGQQQRLCIARTIAVEPEVILMDEPCSALDPISTNKIEELIDQLKRNFTIIIVTHNMQQASRVSDYTAFFNATIVEGGTGKMGYLVEYNPTEKIFKAPEEQATREYVTGRFG